MTIESVLATLYRHVSTSSSSLKLAQPIFRINNSFSNALSTLRIMGQRSSTLRKVQLQGTCDEKFLPVKEQLQKMLEKGGEEHVQLCVYVDGECVIDLYGSAKENTNYDADKVQVRFDCSKMKIRMSVYQKLNFKCDI